MDYAETYLDLLNQMEEIRQDIIKQNETEISFLGRIPEEDAIEIENVLKMESAVLTVLSKKGVATKCAVPNNDHLIKFMINDRAYLNHVKFFPEQTQIATATQSESTTPVTKKTEKKTELPQETEAPNPANHSKEIQEKDTSRTRLDDIVYETLTISLSHRNSEEADIYQIMTAPLKIYKYSTPNVPIIVTILDADGNRITQSSYDSYEAGKNLLQMEVGEYSLLIRGVFDDDGQYHTAIATTDQSAKAGDEIKLLEQKAFGTNAERTLYGHPLVSYISDEGEAIVCIVPIENNETQHYIMISRTEEFTTYTELTPDSNSAVIHTLDGTKTVTPQLDGDYLEISII